MSLVGQKHALPQRNLTVRSASHERTPNPSWGTGACTVRSEFIDIDRYQINMRRRSYLSRRSYGWESKASCVDCGRCSGLEESCKEEGTCRENRKAAQANGRRYETESILSWSFVRFLRIGRSSFSFRRNVFDRTAGITAVAISIF
jgi:hypothetical protein